MVRLVTLPTLDCLKSGITLPCSRPFAQCCRENWIPILRATYCLRVVCVRCFPVCAVKERVEESRARRHFFHYNPARRPKASSFLLQASGSRIPRARTLASLARAARLCFWHLASRSGRILCARTLRGFEDLWHICNPDVCARNSHE